MNENLKRILRDKKLTELEIETVSLVLRGMDNRSISLHTRRAERTIKSRLHFVFAKIGVKSRHALMAWCNDNSGMTTEDILRREITRLNGFLDISKIPAKACGCCISVKELKSHFAKAERMEQA